MRRILLSLAVGLSGLLSVHAQFPGARPGAGPMPGGGPARIFGGGMRELFGETPYFSANMQIETKARESQVSLPGKIAFLDGKSRFEMDSSKMNGGNLPPGAAQQIKAMGMAEVVSINLPDKKETYLIYPGLKSYASVPQNDASASAEKKPDIKKTELGKETVDGHPTTKYKVVMKDDQGKEQEATIWSASDLKNFPLKVQVNNDNTPSTITFSDVKLAKPDASLFEPPSDFQRYNDVQTMMREAMMKRFAPGGAAGGGFAPPPSK